MSPARIVCALGVAATLLSAQDQDKKQAPKADTSQQQSADPVARPKTESGTRSRLPEVTDVMVNTSESKFMTDAAISGMADVQLAQLGQKKGSSDAVKEFAGKLEKDHSAMNEELKKLAAAKNVKLPGEADQKHKAQFDKLDRMEGANFDRSFAKQMVSEHKKAISMFERAERNSNDSDLRAFAAKHLPGLREHLSAAQNLASQKASKAAAPKQ